MKRYNQIGWYNKVLIKINCDNDAFHEVVSQDVEVARILRKLADSLENGDINNVALLRDYNGNRVGYISKKNN